MKRVCIVGASGKLGHYMVQHALDRGYEVVGVCRERSVGKLEAFKGRGNGDFLTSHDMEDIVTIVDGRATLVDEIAASTSELRDYLAAQFAALLVNPAFMESLSGHLPGDPGSQGRLPRLRARLRTLAAQA